MTIRDARNGKLYDLADDGKRLTLEIPGAYGAYGVTTTVTIDKADLVELLGKLK